MKIAVCKAQLEQWMVRRASFIFLNYIRGRKKRKRNYKRNQGMPPARSNKKNEIKGSSFFIDRGFFRNAMGTYN
ncbi:hypothetical protein CW304_06935 [Bacillus sp. UFRGS-B20]|nr:hypothetical protein CW304_06935 [Bacillus sp. UFRGS-B20]